MALPKILGIVLILAGVLLLLFAGGCANQSVALYQSTIGARAGVQATTPLVRAGSVAVTVGKDVDVAGGTASSALVAWNQARLSGDANALTTAAEAATAALTTLEQKLAGLQAAAVRTGDERTAGTAARAKLQIGKLKTIVSSSSAPGTAKKVSPAAVATIIEIAVTELPVLVNWINSALSANTVTDAQIQTELDGLAVDLSTLEAAIASRGG